MAIVVLLCAAGLTAEAARVHRLRPARKDEKGKWQPAEVLRQMQSGVTLQIRYLETQKSLDLIAAALGRSVPLIRGRSSGMDPGHLVFLLQVNNDSPADVHFNPAQVRMASDKGDMMVALDYSAFYSLSRPLGPLAPTMEEVASIFFDRAVTIRPGGSVRKLLAFEAPHDHRFKSVVVKMHEVNIGPQAVEFSFPFRKFVEKK
ncbi:MAG: hypothetical protein ACE5IK_11110 [Acidobacteriota bacterium]